MESEKYAHDVPHPSEELVANVIQDFSVPYTDRYDTHHPLPTTKNLMKAMHPSLSERGANIASILFSGLDDTRAVRDHASRAFENSYILSYAIFNAAYTEAGRIMPGITFHSNAYTLSGSEPHSCLSDTMQEFNTRQKALNVDYPKLLIAVNGWAKERIPSFGLGFSIGAVAMGTSEMYYGLGALQQIDDLNRMSLPYSTDRLPDRTFKAS